MLRSCRWQRENYGPSHAINDTVLRRVRRNTDLATGLGKRGLHRAARSRHAVMRRSVRWLVLS
jgi:hypothetical protein